MRFLESNATNSSRLYVFLSFPLQVRTYIIATTTSTSIITSAVCEPVHHVTKLTRIIQ